MLSHLRDDSETGDSYFRLVRETPVYTAEIHFYELKHDERFEIEGEIFKNRKKEEERTLADTIYLKNKEISGPSARQDASVYSRIIQTEIDSILDSE